MKLTNSEIIDIENQYEVNLYPKRGIVLKKGKGAYIYDQNEKRYLDFMTNIGVNILGYSNKTIENEICKQIKLLPSCHQSFYSEARASLLIELEKILPKVLSKIIFVNSGTEAIEAAIKLARIATGKSEFISAVNSYHGRTLGSLSATGQEKYSQPFLPLLPGFRKVPYDNVVAIKKAISTNTAAIILEPIQGEAGIIIPHKNYLIEVKKLCEQYGALLIIDEIQTALRTGNMFTSVDISIVPDILCLSKSFSYGLPFGMVITTKQIAQTMPKGGHGSTFAGNPLVCNAATQVIRYILNNNLIVRSKILGNHFIKKLETIKHPSIKTVRGRGLMIGLELHVNTTPYIKKMQEYGLLCIPSGSNTIRFLPPLIITKKEIDLAIQIIKTIFS